MKLSCFKVAIATSILLLSFASFGRDHLIYSVSEDLPMGYENEVLKKNYYLNIGNNQGIDRGTVLDVFRTISKANPYESKRRVNYRVKIGELEVVHSDEDASIATMKKLFTGPKDPRFDISNFMIGDHVSVNVK